MKKLLLLILLFVHICTYGIVYTWIPNIKSCPIENIIVPVKVKNFTNISSISLTIHFDNTKLIYTGCQNINPNIVGLLVNGNQSFATISAAIYTLSSYNLSDSATLFEMKFTHNSGDSVLINFDTTNMSFCEYADVSGSIIPSVFYNGYIYNPIISGYVQYDNLLNSPIGNCKVYLIQNGIKIDSTISQIGTGYYKFKCVNLGTYSFDILKINNFGGITSQDALIVAKYSVGMLDFGDNLMYRVADVNNNGIRNASDCLLIMKRSDLQKILKFFVLVMLMRVIYHQ